MGAHAPEAPASSPFRAKKQDDYQLVDLEVEVDDYNGGSLSLEGEQPPQHLSDEDAKLNTIHLLSFARPHMRAFHLAWIGFCTVSVRRGRIIAYDDQ